MLSRLCLLLSIDNRDVGNADAQEVFPAKSVSQLLRRSALDPEVVLVHIPKEPQRKDQIRDHQLYHPSRNVSHILGRAQLRMVLQVQLRKLVIALRIIVTD